VHLQPGAEHPVCKARNKNHFTGTKGEKNMQNLIPIILVVFFAYLIFARKGGMGCCGGHGAHDSKRIKNEQSGKSPNSRMEDVIDLHKDDYTVLSSRVIPPEADKK
jgi:hypothetical protein